MNVLFCIIIVLKCLIVGTPTTMRDFVMIYSFDCEFALRFEINRSVISPRSERARGTCPRGYSYLVYAFSCDEKTPLLFMKTTVNWCFHKILILSVFIGIRVCHVFVLYSSEVTNENSQFAKRTSSLRSEFQLVECVHLVGVFWLRFIKRDNTFVLLSSHKSVLQTETTLSKAKPNIKYFICLHTHQHLLFN